MSSALFRPTNTRPLRPTTYRRETPITRFVTPVAEFGSGVIVPRFHRRAWRQNDLAAMRIAETGGEVL
jgi:hypothetical protein